MLTELVERRFELLENEKDSQKRIYEQEKEYLRDKIIKKEFIIDEQQKEINFILEVNINWIEKQYVDFNFKVWIRKFSFKWFFEWIKKSKWKFTEQKWTN